jgi:imidazole glycerol-phosphate synthase subunit HisH
MIVVVDYGMGNLRSVSKALEHLGAEVRVSAVAADIENAEKVVLPGVGAFGDAMSELRRSGLFEPVRAAAKSGRPFLGICLGLQLLFSESEESPGVEGLGVYPGKVRAFRSKNVKIPHMGWNDARAAHDHPYMKGLPSANYFYFVHSYYAVPEDDSLTVAACLYGEETFPAILGQGKVLATQFHPEKSQAAGLAILKNFVEAA